MPSYPYQKFATGQKVQVKGSWPLETIDLIQGDQVVVKNDSGGKRIVPLADITSPVEVSSDGWFTVGTRPGFAYYIHWDVTTGGPVYRWGLHFASGEIEAFPQPFGLNHSLQPFNWGDYRPVKLTTQALR